MNDFYSPDNAISFLLSTASLQSRRHTITDDTDDPNDNNRKPTTATPPIGDLAPVAIQALVDSSDIWDRHGIFNLRPTLLTHMVDELTRSIFSPSGTPSDILLLRKNRDIATSMIIHRSGMQGEHTTGRTKKAKKQKCHVCEQQRQRCRVCCRRSYCESCIRTVAKRCYTCGSAMKRTGIPSNSNTSPHPSNSQLFYKRPHEYLIRKKQSYKTTLIEEGDHFDEETFQSPSIRGGIQNLLALQNRDQRVIATSAKSWTNAVRNFYFRRWLLCFREEKKSRARMVKKFMENKKPKIKTFFHAWKTEKNNEKLKRISKDNLRLINLADKTRDNVRECMGRERESREKNFQSKAVVSGLVRQTKSANGIIESPLTSGIALGSVLASLTSSFLTIGELVERQMNVSMDVTTFSNLKLGKPYDNAMRGMSTTLQMQLLKHLPQKSSNEAALELLNSTMNEMDDGGDSFGFGYSANNASDSSSESESDSSGSDDEEEDGEEDGEEGEDNEEVVDGAGEEEEEEHEAEEADEEEEEDGTNAASPRVIIDQTKKHRYEKNENSSKYYPDVSEYPVHFDFLKHRQSEEWDWSHYRNESNKALTHTTKQGQALVDFIQIFVGRGSENQVLTHRQQEEKAARIFQSLWRARQARLDWKRNKSNVLAQAMLEREQDDAARIFQAAWRGRNARLEWKKNPALVIEKKLQREEEERLKQIKKKHQTALFDSLEYAVGLGNKAYGSAAFLQSNSGSNVHDHPTDLIGTWRFQEMKKAADTQGDPVGNEVAHLYTNYTNGGTIDQGYLGHDGTGINKLTNNKAFRMGKLAKRMEYLSGTQREGLRFAYMVETFMRMSGLHEFEHHHLQQEKIKMMKHFEQVMKGNLTSVKQKNRGRRPHRKEEEDNWLFLARCSLSVVNAPPIDALTLLVGRCKQYDKNSLSDEVWVTTNKLCASFVSRKWGR